MAPDPPPGVFFDLSKRTKLRVTGNDRLRYLNGQITNNIAKATEKNAIAACVLNAKGRINAHVFLSVHSDAVLIDAEAELREALPARLERYIIADDVQVEDVTDRFSIFHLLSPPPSELAQSSLTISATRFGQVGSDIWADVSQADEEAGRLLNQMRLCDEACAEILRVEQGLPRWGRELTEEIIPVEANLEESCIDYEKGCYIGQEVISRMKMSGQRNKTLCGMISANGSALAPGMRLLTSGSDGKEVGWITSAALSTRFGDIALGYVKRGFNNIDNVLEAVVPEASAGLPAVRVEIVNLPFTRAAVNN